MNKKIITTVKYLAALFVVVFVFAQLYSIFVNPVTTDTVYEHSSFSGYSTKGYIIRNETVITQKTEGALGYEIENGGRVSNKGTIANVYNSSTDAEKKVKLEQLEKKITALENIQSYNDLNAADIGALKANIHNSLIAAMQNTGGGSVDVENAATDELLANLNRYQIVTGLVSDFNALIATLKSERDSLKASMSPSLDTIASPKSGYVIYTVDGFEDSIKVDEIPSLSTEKLQSVEKGEIPDGAMCKIVSDYQWYIAAEIPFSESLNLQEGATVTIKTTLPSVPELKVTVLRINKQSVHENAVVVFSCSTMNTELASTRWLDLTVVYEQYDGLKVDNRAIRVVEGVKGVYVLTASQVKFVEVNVLWTGENYSIVERKNSDSKVLRIYDEIIVKGKNLYDGKIIS